MSDVLHQPPVIDLDALLNPISDESPAGESQRYSGLYDQIAEARRADEVLNQGEWTTELKVADFHRVMQLAVPALSTQTKDLQIAVWLCEAVTKLHGFVGLRDSLQLLTELHARFWETIHPEIDEGDMEGRANAISWFDGIAGFAIKTIPITGGAGYSFNNWEDSKVFDFPENLESLSSEDQAKFGQLKAQAEKEQRVTADMWRKERAATRRAFCEETNNVINECWDALRALNHVIEEKYDRNQTPGLGNLQKSLEAVHDQLKKLLEEKRQEEPDETDAEEAAAGEGGEAGAVSAGGGPGVPTGAIQNRKDAFKRLADIADFFQKTEPHSPVAYLIQRAVKWGHMPLESWLQDVIKDETILYQLRQTLGFNTASGDTTAQGGQQQ